MLVTLFLPSFPFKQLFSGQYRFSSQSQLVFKKAVLSDRKSPLLYLREQVQQRAYMMDTRSIIAITLVAYLV